MAGTVDALDYLAKPDKTPTQPVCALFGDEAFLKQLILAEIRKEVLGPDDDGFSLTRFDGRQIELLDVLDELSTGALFGGGRRLVVVDDADDFVTRYRGELEQYVARPRTSGVLVLNVGTWAATTRLYKLLSASGLQVDCKAPTPARLMKWLVQWCQRRHGAKLEKSAAELLLETIGPELGRLDQELAKLAGAAAPEGVISENLVQDLVVGWRAKKAWDMLDATAAGNARDALGQLDRLIISGESPIGLLAQIGSSLRRFAAATRLIQAGEAAGRRLSPRQALEEAGIKSFFLSKAEGQLRQINRGRASRLYQWLIEADLDLKGQSHLPPRIVLERLIVRLSSHAA